MSHGPSLGHQHPGQDAIEREGILMMKKCHVLTGEAHSIVFCSSQQNNNCLIGIQPWDY